MNKRGQSGGMVVGLVFGIATLVIAVIVAFIVVSTMTGANLLTSGRPTVPIVNESFAGVAQGIWINDTGYTLAAGTDAYFVSGSVSVTNAFNQSDGTTVPSNNYTVSAAGVITNTSVVTWDNVTITYTYQDLAAEENSSNFLSGNFSTGVNNVSLQIPTVLLIAAIVLILGVLAALVAVWQRMRMGGSL